MKLKESNINFNEYMHIIHANIRKKLNLIANIRKKTKGLDKKKIHASRIS